MSTCGNNTHYRVRSLSPDGSSTVSIWYRYSDGQPETDAGIIAQLDAQFGPDVECGPDGQYQCKKWKVLVVGIDNTGTRFDESHEFTITNSDGSVEIINALPQAGWTPQLNHWVDLFTAAYPNLLVEARCNLPGGCGGLLEPLSDVNFNLMRFRYLNITACPGDIVPVKIEVTGSSNPIRVGRVLDLEFYETPEKRGYVCVTCEGGSGPLRFEDGTEVPEADLPTCTFSCAESYPLTPASPCQVDFEEAGCDNLNQSDPANFVSVFRRYVVCDGSDPVVEYYQIDPLDPSALIDYSLVGDFVDCASGEAIPEPSECEEAPLVRTCDPRVLKIEKKCLGGDISGLSAQTVIGSAAQGESGKDDLQGLLPGQTLSSHNPSPAGTFPVYAGVEGGVSFTVEQVDYVAPIAPLSGLTRRNIVIEAPASQSGASTVGSGFDNTTGSSSNPNALLFCFATPIGAFGGTWLDLESGTVNAEMILLDSSENILSTESIVYPNGEDGDDEAHFIGFTRQSNDVSYVLMVVGATVADPNQNTTRLAVGGLCFTELQNAEYTVITSQAHDGASLVCEVYDANKQLVDIDPSTLAPCLQEDDCLVPMGDCLCYGGSGVAPVRYENDDNETDISFSYNLTTIKFPLSNVPAEPDAVALEQAIVDCINTGSVATIRWVDSTGLEHSFIADGILNDVSPDYVFSGTGTGGLSGKVGAWAEVVCGSTDGAGRACSFTNCDGSIVSWRDTSTGAELTAEQLLTLKECSLSITTEPPCDTNSVQITACAAEAVGTVALGDELLILAIVDCNNVVVSSTIYNLSQGNVEVTESVLTEQCDPEPDVETIRDCLIDTAGVQWTQIIVIDSSDPAISETLYYDENLELGTPEGEPAEWRACPNLTGLSDIEKVCFEYFGQQVNGYAFAYTDGEVQLGTSISAESVVVGATEFCCDDCIQVFGCRDGRLAWPADSSVVMSNGDVLDISGLRYTEVAQLIVDTYGGTFLAPSLGGPQGPNFSQCQGSSQHEIQLYNVSVQVESIDELTNYGTFGTCSFSSTEKECLPESCLLAGSDIQAQADYAFNDNPNWTDLTQSYNLLATPVTIDETNSTETVFGTGAAEFTFDFSSVPDCATVKKVRAEILLQGVFDGNPGDDAEITFSLTIDDGAGVRSGLSGWSSDTANSYLGDQIQAGPNSVFGLGTNVWAGGLFGLNDTAGSDSPSRTITLCSDQSITGEELKRLVVPFWYQRFSNTDGSGGAMVGIFRGIRVAAEYSLEACEPEGGQVVHPSKCFEAVINQNSQLVVDAVESVVPKECKTVVLKDYCVQSQGSVKTVKEVRSKSETLSKVAVRVKEQDTAPGQIVEVCEERKYDCEGDYLESTYLYQGRQVDQATWDKLGLTVVPCDTPSASYTPGAVTCATEERLVEGVLTTVVLNCTVFTNDSDPTDVFTQYTLADSYVGIGEIGDLYQEEGEPVACPPGSITEQKDCFEAVAAIKGLAAAGDTLEQCAVSNAVAGTTFYTITHTASQSVVYTGTDPAADAGIDFANAAQWTGPVACDEPVIAQADELPVGYECVDGVPHLMIAIRDVDGKIIGDRSLVSTVEGLCHCCDEKCAAQESLQCVRGFDVQDLGVWDAGDGPTWEVFKDGVLQATVFDDVVAQDNGFKSSWYVNLIAAVNSVSGVSMIVVQDVPSDNSGVDDKVTFQFGVEPGCELRLVRNGNDTLTIIGNADGTTTNSFLDNGSNIESNTFVECP